MPSGRSFDHTSTGGTRFRAPGFSLDQHRDDELAAATGIRWYRPDGAAMSSEDWDCAPAHSVAAYLERDRIKGRSCCSTPTCSRSASHSRLAAVRARSS